MTYKDDFSWLKIIANDSDTIWYCSPSMILKMLGLQWTRWILAQLSTSPILSCNRGFQVRSAASFTAARRGVFAWAVSEPMMGDLVVMIYMISSNVIYSMKSPRGLVQDVNTTLVGVYVVESIYIYQKLSMMVVRTKLSFFLFFIFFGLSRWLRNRWFSGNDSCLEITVPVLWFICMSWSFPLQSHPSWYHCGWDQDKSKGGNISCLVSSHIGLPRGEGFTTSSCNLVGCDWICPPRQSGAVCSMWYLCLSSTEKKKAVKMTCFRMIKSLWQSS